MTDLRGEKTKKREQKEAGFQRAVIDHARRLGWYSWHSYNPRYRSEAGFPDLMLVKDRLVFIELKAYYDNGKAGRVMPEQENFHQMLKEAGQEVYVIWDDADGWELLTNVLSNGRLSVAG